MCRCLCTLYSRDTPCGVCVECLIGKQNKPTLFKVTESGSVPYRTPSACTKRAAYQDPPPVIPVPESIVAQAAYQLRYENTEYVRVLFLGLLRPEMFPGIGAELMIRMSR